MLQLFEDLYLLQTKKGVNVYLLDQGDCFDLVDSGIFMGTQEILQQLEDGGFSPKRLRQIILTHCHCDHIGGAETLSRLSGASIAAHQDDVPYIMQQELISGPYHQMMAQEQRYMRQFDCVVHDVDTALTDGCVLESLGGLQVIQVPGHTPGSIALYQPERRILFLGDVFRHTARQGLVVGIPEKFNSDTPQVVADAHRLNSLAIDAALFGHGAPLLGEACQQLANAKLPALKTPSFTHPAQ